MVDEQITGNMHTTGTCAAFQRKEKICVMARVIMRLFMDKQFCGDLMTHTCCPCVEENLLRLQRYVELVKFISACLLNTV